MRICFKLWSSQNGIFVAIAFLIGILDTKVQSSYLMRNDVDSPVSDLPSPLLSQLMMPTSGSNKINEFDQPSSGKYVEKKISVRKTNENNGMDMYELFANIDDDDDNKNNENNFYATGGNDNITIDYSFDNNFNIEDRDAQVFIIGNSINNNGELKVDDYNYLPSLIASTEPTTTTTTTSTTTKAATTAPRLPALKKKQAFNASIDPFSCCWCGCKFSWCCCQCCCQEQPAYRHVYGRK